MGGSEEGFEGEGKGITKLGRLETGVRHRTYRHAYALADRRASVGALGSDSTPQDPGPRPPAAPGSPTHPSPEGGDNSNEDVGKATLTRCGGGLAHGRHTVRPTTRARALHPQRRATWPCLRLRAPARPRAGARHTLCHPGPGAPKAPGPGRVRPYRRRRWRRGHCLPRTGRMGAARRPRVKNWIFKKISAVASIFTKPPPGPGHRARTLGS